ncbi:hypothetical protein RB195_017800 [Necator americanus]|uniref:Uncharacterized protein n=1 Tax=Necator americanus TaxID=51031 RepID=A0ABR1C9R9_NECAM
MSAAHHEIDEDVVVKPVGNIEAFPLACIKKISTLQPLQLMSRDSNANDRSNGKVETALFNGLSYQKKNEMLRRARKRVSEKFVALRGEMPMDVIIEDAMRHFDATCPMGASNLLTLCDFSQVAGYHRSRRRNSANGSLFVDCCGRSDFAPIVEFPLKSHSTQM